MVASRVVLVVSRVVLVVGVVVVALVGALLMVSLALFGVLFV